MKAGKVKKLMGFSTKILYTIAKNDENFNEDIGICSIKSNMDKQKHSALMLSSEIEKVETRDLTPVDVLELFRGMTDRDV